LPYKLTKQADGDLSLGNLRGEVVTLTPATSDYATGGYLVQGISGATENTGNIGIAKVIFVIPISGGGGYSLNWNAATGKVQVYQTGGSLSAPEAEVAAATNLAAFSFQLLVVGQ
jgi:hypothetical protein